MTTRLPRLSLALPKGRVLDEAVALFGRAGMDLGAVQAKTRRLVHEVPLFVTPVGATARRRGGAGGDAIDALPEALVVYVVRDADVPTYVEHGAADLGIAGRDVLDEEGRDLYEPLDLGIGRCRLAVAEPIDRPVDDSRQLHLRVATKYPRLTRRHLEARGIVADVIKLYGSVELGPLTGLSDRIVDLVSTGETLRQNRLREVETILEVSARLVVNRASLKLKRAAIDAVVERLRRAIARRPGAA